MHLVQIYYTQTAQRAPVEAAIPSPIEHFEHRTQTCLIVHAKSEALVAGERQMVTVAQVHTGDRICCLICSSLPALSLQEEFEIRLFFLSDLL